MACTLRSWLDRRHIMTKIQRFPFMLYVPVKSKLKHPPPWATPRAFEFLEDVCSNSPPPEDEKLFKCPIIGPFQVIKCLHPGKLFSSFCRYAPEAVYVN